MSDGPVGRLWNRVRGQVAARADHLHIKFFPQDDGATMTPDDSYLRVWLSELFLADQVAWGINDTLNCGRGDIEIVACAEKASASF